MGDAFNQVGYGHTDILQRETGAKASVRAPDPTISEMLDELERFVNMMGETVGFAEKALLPILRRPSMGTDAMAGGDSEESVMSGLNMRLQRLSRELFNIRTNLSDVLDRVDL
jgi:hypothetical protein